MRHFMITLSVLALAPMAQAQNHCVDPDNASCFATIQEAVDAAAGGDTITIRAGIYFENVLVGMGLPDLEIRGSGKTILDPDDPNTGPAVEINSPGFLVHGFTIRNGEAEGILVGAGASNGTISDMTIMGPRNDCVRTLADGTLVEDSELMFCGGDCVEATADDTVVRDNTCMFGDNEGVQVTGNRTIIDGNEFQSIEDGTAIQLIGDDAEVTDNEAVGADNELAMITGDNAFVHRNRGMNTEGIDVNGGNATVTDNRLSRLYDPAVLVRCTGCAPGGTVSGNRAEYVSDGDDAFRFEGDLQNLVVEDNRVNYGERFGFRLVDSVDGFQLSDNRASNLGTDTTHHCFLIEGTNHRLEDNRAEDCVGAGFVFGGSSHESTGPRTSWTIGTGITFDGATDVTVNDPRVEDTNGAAYEVRDNAMGIVINSPTVRGDVGQDACDEGAGTSFNDADDLVIAVQCRINF